MTELLVLLACSAPPGGGPSTLADDTAATAADGGATQPDPGDGGATAGGPLPVYDPDGTAFLSTPWPSDGRRSEDGDTDLSTFPNPAAIPLVDTYLEVARGLGGYGNNTAVYLAFDQELDTSLLPDASGSLQDGAALFLVDVDPASPHRGARVPVQWQWSEDATAYLPAHALAVAPVFGFPLRPATTYALVLTTAVAASPAAFQQDLEAADHLAALRDWLPLAGLSAPEVAVAAVFTTADPTASLVAAARWIRRQAPVDLSQSLSVVQENSRFRVYEGTYPGPVFQEGERPYQDEGGGLVLDADPMADPVGWDTMRLALGTPPDLSAPPAAGWPVTIVLHGTGGSYLSGCCQGADSHASVLGEVGGLVLGIDLPLHGTRGGELTGGLSDLEHPYNILNPASARSVQRQSAIDAMYLAHALAQAPTFTLPDGTRVPVDPRRISVLGHSQGGLSLGLAVPFFGADAQAAVMSGTGGGVAITLLERTDPFPIGPVLASVLQLGEGEELTELHPVATLVQWLSEVTDPINTAPYWFAQGPLWEEQAPAHVLHFSGLLDEQSTFRTAEALAAAGRTPPLAPTATWPASWDLAGLVELAVPVTQDAVAFDGAPVTAGFSQWASEGHDVIYENDDARATYRSFLGSVGEDAPVIDR